MNRGADLETWILFSPARYKSHMEKLRKAEEMLANSANKTEARLPTPKPRPEPEPKPEPELLAENPFPEPSAADSPEKPAAKEIGKEQVKAFMTNRLKKFLDLMKQVSGSAEVLELDNLEALIKHALSQSKKSLTNQDDFYEFLCENNLAHLVRNRHVIAKFFNKSAWYHI